MVSRCCKPPPPPRLCILTLALVGLCFCYQGSGGKTRRAGGDEGGRGSKVSGAEGAGDEDGEMPRRDDNDCALRLAVVSPREGVE